MQTSCDHCGRVAGQMYDWEAGLICDRCWEAMRQTAPRACPTCARQTVHVWGDAGELFCTECNREVPDVALEICAACGGKETEHRYFPDACEWLCLSCHEAELDRLRQELFLA